MPRKPKAAAPTATEAGPVSGLAGTFPETVAGLMVVSTLLQDLLADGLREAQANAPIATELEDDAAQMLGYIMGAAHTVIRASVAAGIMPREALDQLEGVVAQADE